jgi:phosphoribosylformimino-5-aminoimidazole carboxamide ribonucleotide (ProFAR) isomerase
VNNKINPIPAIDLVDENVVRLLNGNYDKEIKYSKNPLEFAKQYCNM